MDRLTNAFSVLELDADDDQVNAATFPSASGAKAKPFSIYTSTGKREEERNGSDMPVVKNEEQSKIASVEMASSGFEFPLSWIDLEMTGLNVEVDRILEIACIITDGNLAKSVEGPDLVIHQSKDCLGKMGEWCQTHHEASGLTKKVLHSTISEREAEKQVIEFIKRNVGTHTTLLAGNSVYTDLLFLTKLESLIQYLMANYLLRKINGRYRISEPSTEIHARFGYSLFSHVVVDVSSVKGLCIRWYPRDHKRASVKENRHRAMDDIRESIMELKFYKENIFKAKSKK